MVSTPELIVIFLIIMLVFGGTRLPAMGRGLGQGVREFRDGLRGDAEQKAAKAADVASETAKADSDATKKTPV